MRIALLTGEYPPQPGGIGDYTCQLGFALRAAGFRVAVFTIQDGRFLLYDDHWGAAESAVVLQASSSTSQLSWSPRSWPYIAAALDGWQPDWLHIQYQTGAYGMRAGINFLPRFLRFRSPALRIAVTFHDLLVPYLFPKVGPVRAWVNRRLAADADAVVATNVGDAAQLAQMVLPGKPITTIPIASNIAVAPPLGYDRALWRKHLGVGDNELLVAYFGLLSRSKGADILLDALAQIDPALAWRLLIIGGAATAPPDRAFAAEFTAQIARLGLESRVIRTGHVDAATVSAHLLAADCAALPFRDGASLRRGSLLALLAHGCPLITTTPSDLDALTALANEPAALIVPPSSPLDLTTALTRLATTPDLRHTLAAAAQHAAAAFTWPQIAQDHARLYTT